jgi:peptidoglycan/xylan/chitin deacetylase (PgdA/CDA1 family)
VPRTTVVVTAQLGQPLAGCLRAPGMRELLGRVPVLVVGDPDSVASVRQAGARPVLQGRPGRAVARNVGCASADTELVAFLDGHCHPRGGWLRFLEEAVEGHAGALARTCTHPALGPVRLVSRAGRVPSGYTCPWVWPASGGAIFSRHLLREVGLFSPLVRHWDDLYITARLAGYGCTVGQATEALVDVPSCGARDRLVRHGQFGYWLSDLRRSGELHGAAIESVAGVGSAGRRPNLGRLARTFRPPWSAGSRLPVHSRVRGTGDVRAVHLTIDDGPSPNTSALLRILYRHQAKADFFVVGSQVRAYPRLLTEIVSEGHAVHNHSLTHRQLDGLSQDDIDLELRETARLIRPVSRPRQSLVRLPFGAGANDPYVHDALYHWDPSCELVQWSIDSFDYKSWSRCRSRADVEREAEAAAARVVRSPDLAGSIILMHDSAYGARMPLVDAFSQILLDRMLGGLADRGLVTTLLNGTGR